MRYLILLLTLLSQATFGLAADSFPTKELIAPSEAIQGVWMAKATSEDGGKTVKPASGMLAKMTKASLTFTDGEAYTIKRVWQLTTSDGKAANCMTFNNSNTTVAVSDTSPGLFLIQFFREDESGKARETYRAVFSVEK